MNRRLKILFLSLLFSTFILAQELKSDSVMSDSKGIITESERKQIFFNILTPYLLEKGYKPYLEGEDPSYVLWENNIVYSFFFNFYSDQSIGAFPISITHYEIEDYILKYNLPCYATMEHFRAKEKYHLITTYQLKCPSTLERKPLITKNNIVEFANDYIKYLEAEGKEFIDTYKYLPNILKKMDELRKEGKYWNKILRGGAPHHLMEGVIISKLCNDPDFETKFNWVDHIFLNDVDDKWKAIWLEFKPTLKDIKAKYNHN